MLSIRAVDVADDDSCVVPERDFWISLFVVLLGARFRHVDG